VTSGSFLFDRFTLDPQDRQLRQGDAPVELNSRYFDALTLLVREQGKLVSKDRFLDEVCQGVPGTDEALTQCIKTLRRQLGDDAASPRFIETVPKHGYRFIAPVTWIEPGGQATVTTPSASPTRRSWRRILLLGGAGTIGGGVAGLFGGLFYGAFAVSPALGPGVGAASMLLVLVCITMLIGLLGGAGVAFGIAATDGRPAPPWSVAGGALGGLVVGGFAKLLGLDAFNLLFGQTPGDITGGGEGALLGGAVGLAAWLARRPALSFGRSIAAGGVVGAAAGGLIALLGGRLMAGSLDLLAHHFPNSHLRLDRIGALFGERGFGRISEITTTALEGALFSACVVAAIILARRRVDD